MLVVEKKSDTLMIQANKLSIGELWQRVIYRLYNYIYINIYLKRTAEEAIKFIANEINPDILIWTGDNNNHVFFNCKKIIIMKRRSGPK